MVSTEATAAEAQLPEIPELIILQDDLESDTFVEKPAVPDFAFSLHSRLQSNWRPQEKSLTIRQNSALYSKPILAGEALLLKVKKGAEPDVGWNGYAAVVSAAPQGIFWLGNYRLNAGEGLCLGNSMRQMPLKASIAKDYISVKHTTQKSYILPSLNPQRISFSGAALQTRLYRTETLLWISSQYRAARFDSTHIIQMPDYQSNNLLSEQVREEIGGCLLVFDIFSFRFGVLGFYQNYNHEFGMNMQKPADRVFSGFGSYNNGAWDIGAENAFVNSETAQAIRIGYRQKDFQSKVQYVCQPKTTTNSYRWTQQVFGQAAGWEEISWDTSYRYDKSVLFSGRIALAKNLDSFAIPKWKQRMILSFTKAEKEWQTGIILTQYNKELISQTDSLWFDNLTRQNRIYAFWKQDLSPAVEYEVRCRYQHYKDRNVLKNGISNEHSLSAKAGLLTAKLALLIWSNEQETYLRMGEAAENDTFILLTGSDYAANLALACKLRKRLDISLRYHYPFRHRQKQWLGINCSFFS